jgi:hypothetical protein
MYKPLSSSITPQTLFQVIQKKALELFLQGKYTIAEHTLERMIERNIFFEDIERAHHLRS